MLKLKAPGLLRRQAYIAGAWVDADDGATVAATNPANGEQIGTVPMCGTAETMRAIAAADVAQRTWRDMPAKDRATILRKLNDLMLSNADDLALILTSEQGKPLAEARGEVVYAASFIERFAAEARRIYGDTIPAPQGDRRIIAIRAADGEDGGDHAVEFPDRDANPQGRPGARGGLLDGREAGVAETNFSVCLRRTCHARRLAGGLAVGADRLGSEDWRGDDAQPAGTQTHLHRLDRSGPHADAPVADTIKMVSLELGGNAPFIVFDGADLDAAVEGAMISKYRNTGQTCICANRIYVQRAVLQVFTDKRVAKVKALKVGSGLEAEVRQGPLIDAKAVAKIEEHIADARAKGGEVLTGGKRHTLGGLFFEPTVIAGATAVMLVAHEETFGPRAPIVAFDTEAEVIALANDTEFGLAAYSHTRDIGHVMRVAERLESGIVGVNTSLISTAEAPFGGVKQSGLGREGSKYGLDEFLEVKYVCFGGIDR